MKYFLCTILVIFLFLAYNLRCQVAINIDNSSPDSSAMLDIQSDDKGILIPRLTKVQRDNINNPAQGLLIFQTDVDPNFYYFDGLIWRILISANPGSCEDTDVDGFDICNPIDPNDGDGYPADCDDQNAETYPGAVELCDGNDNDCDGMTDEDFSLLGTPCIVGYGACQETGVFVCSQDGTGVECNAVEGYPTSEMCNGIDDDCDGVIDEDFYLLGTPCAVGVGACQSTGVFVCSQDGNGVECDAVEGYPTSEMCNGIDDDCDGVIDEGLNPPMNTNQNGVCSGSTMTCNGSEGWIDDYTGINNYEGNNEITCDGLDNDCDGIIDEGCDDDGDGYCDIVMIVDGIPAVCPFGGNDCDDGDFFVNPGEVEVCNGVDDDCDMSIDEDAIDAVICYFDNDNDGWGNDNIIIMSCTLPVGYSFFSGDCDDSNVNVHPGAVEICDDFIDNNCNGLVDMDDPDCQ